MVSNITNNMTNAVTNGFAFSFIDYVVFITLLGVSAAIGLYFGFFSKGGNTTSEYLHGGKQMKTLPIAISLVASQLSGIAIMTIPVEIYSYGINYIFTVLSMFLVVPMLCCIAIPVFYENNISNCYEYLQKRFNKTIRQIVTILFILTTFLYLPVFMFIPSLAFSQVTGNNVHLINALVSSICVFYTMLGGIKAVVWTDVVQAVVMIGSMILIAVMGVIGVGGINKVLENASHGGRLTINFDLDFETRVTFWNAFSGSIFMWGSYIGFNQSCVQRIVALPSLSHAKSNRYNWTQEFFIEFVVFFVPPESLYIFAIGFLSIMLVNVFTGIIMYAKYYECDPVALKVVDKADKLVPYFVQDVVGHIYGMPGVFISSVFSASLSTISANLNSLSGIIYFDCVKPYIKHTESKANCFMKICVVVIGAYCVIGGIAVEQFNSILQVAYTISGVSLGTVFGIFSVGLLVPKVNGKAALISLIMSILAMLVICYGAQKEINAGRLSYKPLPSRTDGCEDFNKTLPLAMETNHYQGNKTQDPTFSLFKISFYWYAVLGTSFIWISSIILSFVITSDKKVDPQLLSPIVRPFSTVINREMEEVPLKQKLNVDT